MEEFLTQLLIYTGLTALMLAVAGGVYLASSGKRRRAALFLQGRWSDAAAELGLTFEPSEPGGDGHPGRLHGTLDGRRVEVDVLDGGKGRVTRFQLRFSSPLPVAFRIWLVPSGSRGTMRTGDPRFDECFQVDGADSTAALRLLSSEVRDALVDLDGFRPSPTLDTVELEVRPDGLRWCKRGLLSPDIGLVACVRRLAEVGRALELGGFDQGQRWAETPGRTSAARRG